MWVLLRDISVILLGFFGISFIWIVFKIDVRIVVGRYVYSRR